MTIDAHRAGEADLSAYVLTLIDRHLHETQHIRDRMRTGSTTAAGARRVLALDSIEAAERYAAALRHALGHPGLENQLTAQDHPAGSRKP
jgi:hypothetical protein